MDDITAEVDEREEYSNDFDDEESDNAHAVQVLSSYRHRRKTS